MDKARFRKRFRLLLAVGGLLIALVYVGDLANRTRLTWAEYRAEADQEKGKAQAAEWMAYDTAQREDQARKQGQLDEVEGWARLTAWNRQEQLLHQRKSREWLSRWW